MQRCTFSAWGAAAMGQPRPAFPLPDTTGHPGSLVTFKGRTKVLECHNPGGPFGRQHHSGNLAL